MHRGPGVDPVAQRQTIPTISPQALPKRKKTSTATRPIWSEPLLNAKTIPTIHRFATNPFPFAPRHRRGPGGGVWAQANTTNYLGTLLGPVRVCVVVGCVCAWFRCFVGWLLSPEAAAH